MGRKSASKSPSKDQNKEQSTDSVKSAVPEPAAPSDLALPGKTSQRRFSLIVWGATGFTGSLVCRQLAETYPVRTYCVGGFFTEYCVRAAAQRRSQPPGQHHVAYT